VRKRDVILFTRRLSDLLSGGLPVTRSLDVLIRQSRDDDSRAFLRSLRSSVDGGRSLSEAMSDRPDLFDSVYVGLVRAGEISGSVERNLEELASVLDAAREARRQLSAALIYPAFVALLGLGVTLFVTGFVVPKFESLFTELGQALPWPTRLLMAVGSFVRQGGWAVPLVVPAVVGWRIRRGDRARLERWVLKRTPAGSLLSAAFLRRWAALMASLLRSGFTVSDALRASEGATRSAIFGETIRTAEDAVAGGLSVSHALARGDVFSPAVTELIGAAEEAGTLESAFDRIAAVAEKESVLHSRLFLAALEPVLIVALAAGVGFVAVAMLLPIFQMSAGFR
jgi:type II secretory pathway component PulF